MRKNIGFLRIIALMVVIGLSMTACGGSSGKTFADVGKVEDWLASQKGGGSPDDPIPFSVKTNLQNMASAESNWHKLLTSIDTAGLYVALDLSGCTMPTTEFDADGGITKGKKFIVSLVLPDSTESIAGNPYRHFNNLKTISGKRKSDYLVGDTGPAGGIIFFDKGNDSGGWRYLEVAPAETEFHRVLWSGDLEGTKQSIGTGKRNTEIIVEYLGEKGEAAQVCAELNYNGHSDWFLPSIDELELAYENLHKRNLGGFNTNYYCSSSRSGFYNFAWVVRFGDGRRDDGQYSVDYYGYPSNKNYGFNVRAVRAF